MIFTEKQIKELISSVLGKSVEQIILRPSCKMLNFGDSPCETLFFVTSVCCNGCEYSASYRGSNLISLRGYRAYNISQLIDYQFVKFVTNESIGSISVIGFDVLLKD